MRFKYYNTSDTPEKLIRRVVHPCWTVRLVSYAEENGTASLLLKSTVDDRRFTQKVAIKQSADRVGLHWLPQQETQAT